MTAEEILKKVPKAVLHDHLDGGLRTQTIIELAEDLKYEKLPTKDAGELAEWFYQGA
ncbi:MAG: adenosine deaminase, partial [Ignavibacteria bacterium]